MLKKYKNDSIFHKFDLLLSNCLVTQKKRSIIQHIVQGRERRGDYV